MGISVYCISYSELLSAGHMSELILFFKYIYIYIYIYIYYIYSGGPLSALTCCVNVRLLSAIKNIAVNLFSKLGWELGLYYALWWLSPWYFSADVYLAELHCRGARTSLRTRGSQSVMDRLLTAGLCGNTIGRTSKRSPIIHQPQIWLFLWKMYVVATLHGRSISVVDKVHRSSTWVKVQIRIIKYYSSKSKSTAFSILLEWKYKSTPFFMYLSKKVLIDRFICNFI